MKHYWVLVVVPDNADKFIVNGVVTDALIDSFGVDPQTHVESPDDPLYRIEG